jgi:hypothetical protein
MNVVSLPKAFVFRINLDDPHPIPWIRVKLSCQMGKAIYPHPQWDRLARLWNWLYPTGSLAPDKQRLLSTLEAAIPEFVRVVLQHRPRKLRGRTLLQVMDSAQRQPAKLSSMFRQWSMAPEQMLRWSPSLVFAVIGQAKGDGLLTAGKENRILTRMLTHWALKARVDATPDGAMPAALAA